MTTKAEQLEELKATAVKLQQQIEDLKSSKCKRFKPETEIKYHLVSGNGATSKTYNNDLRVDKDYYNNFNCYETKELATKALPMMKRSNAIIMACLIVDPDFVPDYFSGNQIHYSFRSEPPHAGWKGGWFYERSYYVNEGPCVSTQEKWDEAAALLTEWGIE